MFGRIHALLATTLALAPLAASAAGPASESIEALLDTEVSSVLKHASGLADAPAAVTVLRQEDIERLGATTLPDLLRVVPGIMVAQVDGNKWAVGSRGFNGFFGGKLLVLVDGRSIYNGIFSGVFWDAHDLPLDNIARIEVLRGPGAALWGSNAVNGVINIVTRSAQETQGGRVAVGAGNVDQHLLDIRQGGVSESAAWRLYARSRGRSDQELPGGGTANDSAHSQRAGFRIDSTPSPTAWMVSGEAQQGRSGGAPYPQSTTEDIRNYHLLGRLSHHLDSGATLQLQTYFDSSWRRDLAVGSALQEDIFDLDIQHDVLLTPSQRLIWGGGWRQNRFSSVGSVKLAFVPDHQSRTVTSVFVQDEWEILPQELILIGGVRAEQLPRHGMQWQPSLRATWNPLPLHTFWMSTGQAVRAPNNINTSVRYNGPIGSQVAPPLPVFGNPDFAPERITSLELGWRARLSPKLSTDVALYSNRYRQLESLELAPSLVNLSHFNHARATTQGLEWALDWQASDNWQLRSGLTLYREHSLLVDPQSTAATVTFHDMFPNRQAFLRSLWDINAAHRLDVTWRGAGPLSHRGIPGYGTSDLRWTWRRDRFVELSMIARNIGGPRHREISEQAFFRETITRPELFVSLVWRY